MNIYVDMDQVLSDFLGGAYNLLGYHFESLNHDPVRAAERNRIVGNHPTFWEELPAMPDAHILWRYVEPYNPFILSALPRWEDHHVIPGKKKWVTRYLGIELHRVHLVPKQDKALFARTGEKQNILIDDDKENIHRFIDHGGIGVLHETAHTTIEKLKMLGVGPMLVNTQTS